MRKTPSGVLRAAWALLALLALPSSARAWETLDGRMSLLPSVTDTRNGNQAMVWVVGVDGLLYCRRDAGGAFAPDANPAWTGFSLPPGVTGLVGRPSTASYPPSSSSATSNNLVFVAVRGSNGRVFLGVVFGLTNTNPGTVTWHDIGGSNVPGDPVVVVHQSVDGSIPPASSIRAHVFVRGFDSHLYRKRVEFADSAPFGALSFTPNQNDWTDTGGLLVGQPGVALRPDNHRMYVYVRGQFDNQLWEQHIDEYGSAGAWSVRAPGPFAGDPIALFGGAGYPAGNYLRDGQHVVIRRPNGHVAHYYSLWGADGNAALEGTGYSGDVSLTMRPAQADVFVLDVVGRGNDGSVWHESAVWYTSGAWAPDWVNERLTAGPVPNNVVIGSIRTPAPELHVFTFDQSTTFNQFRHGWFDSTGWHI